MENDSIREAFLREADFRCSEYRVIGDKHHFSLGYIINRRKIIKKYKNGSDKKQMANRTDFRIRPVLRINIILLVIFLAVTASAAFMLYTVINGFSFSISRTHSVVKYLDTESVKSSVTEEYYIPETDSLKIINTENLSYMIKTKYEYHNEEIIFRQMTPDTAVITNTENNPIESLELNGNKGFYIDMNGETYICWAQDGYVFSLLGKINKNTAIELAKQTKMK